MCRSQRVLLLARAVVVGAELVELVPDLLPLLLDGVHVVGRGFVPVVNRLLAHLVSLTSVGGWLCC
jgi:hypothetical protein